MENRSDDLEQPLCNPDSAAPVEKHLDVQIKPAAQWLKHINQLCNEIDNTTLSILSSDQRHTQRSQQSNDIVVLNRTALGKSSPTIAQFQELASQAQKELYRLKSHTQKDASAINRGRLNP